MIIINRKQAENAVEDTADRVAEREMEICWGKGLGRIRGVTEH